MAAGRYGPILRLCTIVLVGLILTGSFSALLMDFDWITSTLARQVLSLGLPAVIVETEGYPGWTYTGRSLLYMFTGYDIGNPRTMLASLWPMLDRLIAQEQEPPDRSFAIVPELQFRPEPTSSRDVPALSLEPPPARVLVYHTHTSEMYLGPDAATNAFAGSHHVFRSSDDRFVTGVIEVGKHLTRALQVLGIEVIHDRTLHDFPSISYSYVNSERTVSRILAREKDIALVFDVHRDARVPEPRAEINGQTVAKVMLVVATAQDVALDHPNWQQNLAFAERFQATAMDLYPGLVRPMQIRRNARFNQHLHPHSVLIEIGSVENTLEEALAAAELTANIIYHILKEDRRG